MGCHHRNDLPRHHSRIHLWNVILTSVDDPSPVESHLGISIFQEVFEDHHENENDHEELSYPQKDPLYSVELEVDPEFEHVI